MMFHVLLSTDLWSSAGDVLVKHHAPPPPQSSIKPAAPAAPAPASVAPAGKTHDEDLNSAWSLLSQSHIFSLTAES